MVMRSRSVLGFADGCVEAVWLALALLLPLSFNAFAQSNFALPKTVWLRLLIPVGVAALAISTSTRRRRAAADSIGAGSLRWAFAGLLAAIVASTVTAVAPDLAFWGTALRGGGALTLLCQLGLAALVAARLETEAQWTRLAYAIILAGCLVASFALVQAFGVDPFEYSLRYEGQSSATTAHPSALGAYLLFPTFLLVERLIEAVTGGGRIESKAVLAGGLLVMGAAMFVTRNRAALVAIAAGGLVWWLLAAIARRPARSVLLRPTFPLAVAGVVAVAAVAGLASSPLQSLRLGAGRPAAMMDTSVARRLLLWETAAEALWEGPMIQPEPEVPTEFRFAGLGRTLLGYGPESAGVVLTAHTPAARARQLARRADSTHSVVLDLLIEHGVIGLVVTLWAVCAVVAFLARALGLISERRHGDMLVAALIGGGVVGFLAPILLARAYGYDGAGLMTLSGPGLGAGMLAGWIVFLAIRSPAGREPDVAADRSATQLRSLRLQALAAALVAYTMAALVGLPGIAASGSASLVLGALLAIAMRSGLAIGPPEDARPVAACLALMAAVALGLGFAGAPSGLDPLPAIGIGGSSARVDRTWVGLATVLSLLLALLLARTAPSSDAGRTRTSVARRAGAAAAVILAALAVPLASEWLHGIPAADAAGRLDGIVVLGRIAVGEILLLMMLLAYLCGGTDRVGDESGSTSRRWANTAAALALMAVLIFANPQQWLEANIGMRRGAAYVALTDLEVGLPTHEWALERWSHDADAWLAAAHAYAAAAMRPDAGDEFDGYVERALDALGRAVEIDDWSASKRAELAGLHVLVASIQSNRAGRILELEEALTQLRIARYLQPSSLRIGDDLTAVQLQLAGQRRRD